MNEWLEKKATLFERGEDGKLLPVEMVVEFLPGKPKILATPLTKGGLQKLAADAKDDNTTRDQDNEIILKHCKKPGYNEEEVKVLKSKTSNAMVIAIIAYSLDIGQEEMKAMTVNEAVKVREEYLKKK